MWYHNFPFNKFNHKLVDLPWELELTLFGTFAAKCAKHSSIDVENLNSMVIRVGYYNPVRIGNCNVMWMF